MSSRTPESAVVDARGLRYAVRQRLILDDVDLEVLPGAATAITGPSGSGKTTLLMCLAGLLPTASGRVRIAGQEITQLSSRQRAAVRLSHIGLVYQFGELLQELSPIENVALPALLSPTHRKDAFSRAGQLLRDLGIADLAGADTSTLSGGERQRVAVARALVTKPVVVLADEPTGSLDRAAADVVSDLLFELPKQYNVGLVVVTHNQRVAGRADQQLELDSGVLSVMPG